MRSRDEHRPDEAYARERDEADPLASVREAFHLPDDELYLDGNSLGPLPRAAVDAVDRAMAEWRDLGIRGWTEAETPWFWYGERLGDRVAPLVGADPDEVVVANSTTVNIHALIATFFEPGDGRTRILVDELDFPTDHYAIRAQLRWHGLDPDEHLVVVESRDGRTIDEADVIEAMDDDVALAFLPSVLYRNGQLLDVPRLTAAAHERDIPIGFDLAHSVGVVPHELSEAGVDFAVWCSYKYLNAGPGAVAGLYVNERHFGSTPALPGWWGHEKETQFDMNLTYEPAATAGAWQIGTIPVLSAAPLWGALRVFDDVSIEAVREKSLALTDYLVYLVDERPSAAPYDFRIGTPREPDRRGGHVAVEHPTEAYRIAEALRDRGVVVDYRPPDVIRICPSPLYGRFLDVYRVAEHLRDVVDGQEYEAYEETPGGVT